ncbi:MAG: ATP-binding protein [Bryobacteraceae bacterium]|nr:ATP-binding protein [Bryobacteraceae bacterium]
MSLRWRLLALSVGTMAAVVFALLGLHLNALLDTAIANALERNIAAGERIQSFLGRRMNELTAARRPPPAGPEQLKRLWRSLAAEDGDLAEMLESTMLQTRSIVEIRVLDGEGSTLASSIPANRGRSSPARPALSDLSDRNPIAKLSAVLFASEDYESRFELGIPGEERAVLAVQVLASTVLLRDQTMPQATSAIFVSALALLAAIGLAYSSARIALSPLDRISTAIDRIAEGAAPPPAEPASDRDIARVESRLNLLGAKVSGERRDADHLRSSLGTLTRGVMHELKNPLNAMALRLELLRTRFAGEQPDAAEEVELLSREVRRMDRVLKDFLDLSRPVELRRAPVDLVALTGEVLRVLEPEARRGGVEVRFSPESERVIIEGDADLLRRAILNLVKNAIEAMPGGGTLTASVSAGSEGGEIRIADTGKGIPPEEREKIFNLYFTTKPQGSGIGLASARRAAQLHGGDLKVESEVGRGSEFRLRVGA